MRRLVVQPHRPWVGLLMLLLVVVVAFLVYQRQGLESERAALVKSVRALEERLGAADAAVAERGAANWELREQLATLSRARQVDEKAYEEVDGQIRAYQDEVLSLREEVAFYRKIISADRGKGLHIQALLVSKEPIESTYRFELVLTRHMNSDKVTSGRATMTIAGEMDGRAVEIPLAEAALKGNGELTFEFKFFQRLQGRFSLPAKFAPKLVHIVVEPGGGRESTVERTFEWEVGS